jgi:hypothetical protein
MKQIAQALVKAQSRIKNASKDATNPHFRNDYATLESVIEAIKDIATQCEIAIVQTCGKDSEGHFLETHLFHTSGETISSRIYLVMDKQNMQGLGSAITYARRYSLAGLFMIGQEDDDGNGASKPKPSTPAQKPTQTPPKPMGATTPSGVPVRTQPTRPTQNMTAQYMANNPPPSPQQPFTAPDGTTWEDFKGK